MSGMTVGRPYAFQETAETATPADAGFLRTLAEYEIQRAEAAGPYEPMIMPGAKLTAARLRALADMIENISPARLAMVRRQFVGPTNQLVPADLDAYDALCAIERAVSAIYDL